MVGYSPYPVTAWGLCVLTQGWSKKALCLAGRSQLSLRGTLPFLLPDPEYDGVAKSNVNKDNRSV